MEEEWTEKVININQKVEKLKLTLPTIKITSDTGRVFILKPGCYSCVEDGEIEVVVMYHKRSEVTDPIFSMRSRPFSSFPNSTSTTLETSQK
jgi:hypothetical protein